MTILSAVAREYLEMALISERFCKKTECTPAIAPLGTTSLLLGLPSPAHVMPEQPDKLFVRFHDTLRGFYPIIDEAGHLGAFIEAPAIYDWRTAS